MFLQKCRSQTVNCSLQHAVAPCVQVEEVVTAFAPACKESGGIFEMTFSVSQPGKIPEAEAMISASSLSAG